MTLHAARCFSLLISPFWIPSLATWPRGERSKPFAGGMSLRNRRRRWRLHAAIGMRKKMYKRKENMEGERERHGRMGERKKERWKSSSVPRRRTALGLLTGESVWEWVREERWLRIDLVDTIGEDGLAHLGSIQDQTHGIYIYVYIFSIHSSEWEKRPPLPSRLRKRGGCVRACVQCTLSYHILEHSG